jgi:hypothetical protein
MKMTTRKPFAPNALVFIVILSLVFGLGSLCRAQRDDGQLQAFHKRVKLLDSIRLGDSAADVARKIEGLFVSVQTNRYFGKYPFRELLPYTNNAVVLEWRSQELTPDHWPEIVFAVFSNANKTNLVDALWFSSENIRPLVNGLYNQNLLAVKKGDSVQKLYALVGQRDCKYFRSDDGKWRVRFFYWGYDGRMITIEADAAEGVVVKAADGTI